MASQVFPVRLGQHLGNGERDGPNPQRKGGSIGNLCHYIPSDLQVCLRWSPITGRAQRSMLPFHDDICFIQGNPMRTIHPLEARHVFIHFKNDSAGFFHNGFPTEIGEAQSAIPLFIRFGYGNDCHIHPEIIPIHFRQQAQEHGNELEPSRREHFPFIAPQMPAVILEMLPVRITVDGMDDRTVH